MRTFPYGELAANLASCREKSCILSYNPASFLHDVLYLPPAASKFLDVLVAAEVVKNHPGLDSFTLFHRTLGETTTDGAPYRKIAAFSYPDISLAEIMALFNRCKIVITHLYAAPYPIFRLAAAACVDDSTVTRIFIAALPGEKLFLLSENNELGFIRKLPSENRMLLPDDILNLNMTIDYCFQTLRLKPAEAIMLNPGDLALPLTVPIKSFSPLPLGGIPHQIVSEYLAPLAAALHHRDSPDEGNILPPEYVTYTRNKKIIALGTLAMILVTLIMGGLLFTEWEKIMLLRSRIDEVKARLGNSAKKLSDYRKLDQQTTKKAHILEYLNRSSDSTDPGAALASLTLAKGAEYAIKGVSLRSGAGFVEVGIKGDIAGSGFRETQSVYEEVVRQVNTIPGYVVASSTVDVKLKTFTIDARYSAAGGRPAP